MGETARQLAPGGDSLQLSDEAMYDYASTAYYWARGWFQPASLFAAAVNWLRHLLPSDCLTPKPEPGSAISKPPAKN